MSTEKGKKAEDKAARFLRLRGYRILDRNARLARGELDIVAAKGDTLAFVEVKLRPDRESGLLSVHADKQARLRSAAAAWLATHADYQQRECRFDLLIVTPGGLHMHIEHLPDVFR